jgi:AcrR family transcriptional regulator
MPPRSYNIETRLQQQQSLRQRIVEAAVQMHAAKGGLATTYGDIAQAAGVSLPTVHKHFPSADELFRSCTGHVAALAPPVPAADILAAPSIEEAARMLVDAVDRVHAHFEPWKVWREHEHIQVLADIALRVRKDMTELCAGVLTRHGAATNVRETAAVWESLLDFEPWHRLVREHKLPRATVRTALLQLLLAVTGPQPAAPSSPRPKSRNPK